MMSPTVMAATTRAGGARVMVSIRRTLAATIPMSESPAQRRVLWSLNPAATEAIAQTLHQIEMEAPRADPASKIIRVDRTTSSVEAARKRNQSITKHAVVSDCLELSSSLGASLALFRFRVVFAPMYKVASIASTASESVRRNGVPWIAADPRSIS